MPPLELNERFIGASNRVLKRQILTSSINIYKNGEVYKLYV